MKVGTIVLGAVAAVVLSAGAAAATWVAVDGGDAAEAGQCAAATYSMEAEREDGSLEVSFELQTAAPGEAWDVEIAHEGEVLISGERQTDADAEIDVDVYAPEDSKGEFTATATPESGDPCVASLTTN